MRYKVIKVNIRIKNIKTFKDMTSVENTTKINYSMA